jgi:integrase/recombinase XerD
MDEKSDAKIIYDFIAFQNAQRNSGSTIKLYSGIIKEFSKWLKRNDSHLAYLTRLDVQNYIKHLSEKGLSASTIENKFAAISSLLRFLGEIDIIQNLRKPENFRPRNISPRSLDKNERNKMLRELERSKNLRNVAIAYLLLYTGIRVSELVALNKQDVICEERSGTVTIKNGKGNVERKIPLPSEARTHIKNYLNARKDTEEALFLSNYKKRISVRAIQRVFEKFNIHPHQLRHTYCRELVLAGIDISIVADLAGHSDINVTRRYSKPSAIEIEGAIEKAFE